MREAVAAGVTRTRLFGVIGASVGHSLSPAMHRAAFAHLNMAAVYLPFDVTAGAVARALAGAQALSVWGLNVTAPHKERAFELATVVSDQASSARAANTLRLWPDGAIEADSTDGYAVVTALDARRPHWEHGGARCLVLGAGGVARVAAVALAQRGAAVDIAARRPEGADALVRQVRAVGGTARAVAWEARGRAAEAAMVTVQATPLGAGSRQRGDPLAPDALPGHLLVEMAYGPQPTPLEARAKAAGRPVVDGREILARQGARAWRLWFGVDGPLDVMLAAVYAPAPVETP